MFTRKSLKCFADIYVTTTVKFVKRVTNKGITSRFP